MQIRTSKVINSSRETLWPLLTHSRMDVPGWFCLGVPQPKRCELPDRMGGVGSERRCLSDRGTVVQRITVWEPPSSLQFQMVSTDHSWGPLVQSLEEKFDLEPVGNRTKITRTTKIRAKGFASFFKEWGFYAGLKRVHHHVFANWKHTAEQGRRQTQAGHFR